MSKSDLEAHLLRDIHAYKLPEPEREVLFHDTRKWRLDFAWPELLLAVEVQGGLYVKGAHNRGAYIEETNDKYNEAQLAGWIVLQFGPKAIESGVAIDTIRRAVAMAQEATI